MGHRGVAVLVLVQAVFIAALAGTAVDRFTDSRLFAGDGPRIVYDRPGSKTLERSDHTGSRGGSLLGGLCLVALVMWGAGYFMLKAGVQSGGFGFYRMNLLSLLDSNGVWSQLLPDLPNMPGDYEGFSFLGIGLILLAAAALVVLIVKNILGRMSGSFLSQC